MPSRKPTQPEPKLRIEIGKAPHDIRIYVGEEQIGLIADLEVKASISGESHVYIKFAGATGGKIQEKVERYREMLKPFSPFVSTCFF